MIKATESSQNDDAEIREKIAKNLIRECPSCGHFTIKEMPGGRDAVCNICGYKDPCCYD